MRLLLFACDASSFSGRFGFNFDRTSRAGELRSAPSGPDDRYRVAGKRALALGGARSQGHNTGLRGLAPCTGFPLNCRTPPLYSELKNTLRGLAPRTRFPLNCKDAPSTRS